MWGPTQILVHHKHNEELLHQLCQLSGLSYSYCKVADLWQPLRVTFFR